MPLQGKTAPASKIKESYDSIAVCLSQIELKWFPETKKTKYMFGEQMSIADLSLACELA